MNRHARLALALTLGLIAVAPARADSIWARRDPKTAYLFNDYRARQVGDVLTIEVSEITAFEGQEKRELNKETKTGATAALNLKAKAGSIMSRAFAGSGDASVGSQRKFDGTANNLIDRKFIDRMTVVVVGVMPNGNLLIEGFRQRVVSREVRVLRVTGIVRPADIGPWNTVQSQYIGNFSVIYEGRGPDSRSTNHNWGGRIMNVLWPF